MKKYVKPEIYYEQFQMSQSIAACGWQVNSGDVESCGATGDFDRFSNPSITLFTNSVMCQMHAEDAVKAGFNFNFYCYMTGAFSEGDKTFQS